MKQLQSDLSKQYIVEALISIMNKKKFSKITNKDITDKAGLSHITVYRNFKTKEDILEYHLKNLLLNFKEESNNPIYTIFNFFHTNKDFISLLYKNNLDYLIIKSLLSRYDYSKEDNNIIAYTKSYFAYSIYGLCNEWFKRGMQESPDEIVKLIEQNKSN